MQYDLVTSDQEFFLFLISFKEEGKLSSPKELLSILKKAGLRAPLTWA